MADPSMAWGAWRPGGVGQAQMDANGPARR